MTGLDLSGVPLVLVVGAGGVGKTTIAAALAVREAMLGRRALVLTVDPARRLGSVLGVSLSDAARPIPLPAGAASGGSLAAAMLESGPSFDALVGRIVDGPAARSAILASATYQAFSRTLARSHSYAAIERLHSLTLGAERTSVDVLVLDTPPGAAALDLLDAPGALARFAEDRVVSALADGGGSALLFGIRALLRTTAGAAVARELAEFLGAFLPARRGFAERARQVDELFRTRARRVLVVAPDPTHLREAIALFGALAARGLEPHATVANRAFARREPAWSLADAARELTATVPEREALAAAHDLGTRARALDETRHRRLARFLGETATPIALTLGLRAEEPASVQALLDLLDGAAPAS